jgi:hypothetical protein
MVFPEPAKNGDDDEGSIGEELEKHTFAIDPQKGAGQLPFGKNTVTTLEKPLRSSPMAKVARDVVI